MGTKKDIKFILEDISKTVEPAIYEILLSAVHKKFHNIVKYQIEAGGKRLRPALAILTCRMMGGKLKDVLYPAAALEILHNYTLIIDDIIDHSEFRRKKPTVWKKYGVSIADFISMSYAASIFNIPIKIKNKEKIYHIFAKTLKAVTSGQIFDILLEQSGREEENYVVKNRYSRISLKNYFEMIEQKTASLLSACCEVGGICAGSKANNLKNLKILKKFGRNLGIAFQIHDDILDIFGEEKKFGKKIGKDIMERKLGNIVILLAVSEFNRRDKLKFIKILKNKKINNNNIKKAIHLIKKTAGLKRAQNLADKFTDKARNNLKSPPRNKWNNALRGLTDYLVNRKA